MELFGRRSTKRQAKLLLLKRFLMLFEIKLIRRYRVLIYLYKFDFLT